MPPNMLRYPSADSAGLVEVAKKFCHRPDKKELLTKFVERFKAGSPTDPTVFWINKKPKELAKAFAEEHKESISTGQVKRLLQELGYGYRKQSKQLATGEYAQRDEQFKIIMHLILCMSIESPIISIDCKKKERLGNLYRDGKCYCQAPIEVFDHDYEHLSQGKVVPHGIYDLQLNKGYVSIGASAETADFVADNLRWWWTTYGIVLYPKAKNILILCDAGGANSCRHHLFKEKMLELSQQLGMSFIICHYPPYASKWNPIEHRLFCHVHQAMSGVVFSDYQTVKERIEATSTNTGLSVVVRIVLKEYPTGDRGDKNVKNDKRIQFHPNIPKLNYRINPN
jgi:hypothetical protein